MSEALELAYRHHLESFYRKALARVVDAATGGNGDVVRIAVEALYPAASTQLSLIEMAKQDAAEPPR